MHTIRSHDILAISLRNSKPPTKLILLLTQLNALQVRQHLQANRSSILLPLRNVRHRLRPLCLRNICSSSETAGAAARDAPDGHQCGSRSSGKHFAKGRQLGVLDDALLDLPAVALGQRQDAAAGDAVDDALGVGHHEGDVVAAAAARLDADEAAGAELVNVLVPGAVQVQRDSVSLRPRLVAPSQDWRIVAADLCVASAVGRRAVELVEDQRLYGMNTVVHARGDDEDAKGVLLRRGQAQLSAGAVDLRADVHGGAGLVGRNIAGIECNGGLDRLKEQLDGHRRHAGDLGRVLEPHGVAVRAEDGDVVVAGQAECLEALVGLLAVVERRRHAVDAHVRVRHILDGRPLARVD